MGWTIRRWLLRPLQQIRLEEPERDGDEPMQIATLDISDPIPAAGSARDDLCRRRRWPVSAPRFTYGGSNPRREFASVDIANLSLSVGLPTLDALWENHRNDGEAVGLMIPDFDPATGYLPEGEHVADWSEVDERFAWNSHRQHLLSGLRRLAAALRDGGCRLFLLDGSFVTRKEFPGDFDACCDYSGMSAIFVQRLRLTAGKEIMKAEYFGEVYPYAACVPSQDRYTFREFFQRDVDDIPKGLVRLNLASVP